jgi:hypothetical protein
MSYPASINSLTEKTDGPGQIIYAAHMNNIRTALLDLVTALGNAPQGNLASVEARLDGVVDDDGKPVNLGNVFVVSKSGSKYSTIQSAIDASDPSFSNPACILVMPGTYVETVTLKPYVHVVGIEEDSCRIDAPSGQYALIMATNSSISNFLIYSNQAKDTVSVGSSVIGTFYNCSITIEHSGAYYALHVASGFAYCYNCTITGVDQNAILVSSGYLLSEKCNITGGDEVGCVLVASYANFRWSMLNGSDSACISVDIASTAAFRFCTWNNAPTGAGSIDLGALSGTNANTDPNF